MNRSVQLPIGEMIYSTYLHQGVMGAITARNPSIRNWYLNNTMQLMCNRKFLHGYSTPEVYVPGNYLHDNPYFLRETYQHKYLGSGTGEVIRRFIDAGQYVYFTGIDDYYMKDKSWYLTRHFSHDGLICGYDRDKKTYSVFAYDSKWIFRIIEIPWRCFDEARRSSEKLNYGGVVCACTVKNDTVELNPEQILVNLKEYLTSSLEKYPPYVNDDAYGIVVHDYGAMYLDRLMDGVIPYERIDRRVFRMFWEHKKVMLERIRAVEDKLGLAPIISVQYEPLVKEADDMRMLFAAYTLKKRDTILLTVKNKLLNIKNTEAKLLNEFVGKLENTVKK